MSTLTSTATTTTFLKPEEVSTAAYARIEASYSFRADNQIDPHLKRRIATALGYNAADLNLLPEAANLGESCGNPLAIAALKEGETVVDLGSGGGYDALLAAQKVGTSGKVIGIDMTAEMINLARKNVSRAGAENVSFIHSKINDIPLESKSIDCVVSNCVLNLVPESDKTSVIREIHRILRPCGRLAISDFLALKPLPNEIKNDPDLIAGCVGGAIELHTMEKLLVETGFDDVLLVATKTDLNIYKDGDESASVTPCCAAKGVSRPNITASGRKKVDFDLNEWIGSFEIYAHKSCGKNKGPKQTVLMKGVFASEEQMVDSSQDDALEGCKSNVRCC